MQIKIQRGAQKEENKTICAGIEQNVTEKRQKQKFARTPKK